MWPSPKGKQLNYHLTEPSLWVILDQFALVDCSDPQLTLHSSNERWPLEESASQHFHGLWIKQY